MDLCNGPGDKFCTDNCIATWPQGVFAFAAVVDCVKCGECALDCAGGAPACP
jgi:hypothetical protein